MSSSLPPQENGRAPINGTANGISTSAKYAAPLPAAVIPQSTLGSRPATEYKNSISHPINVSLLIPLHITPLLTEDMHLPEGRVDLYDMLGREQQVQNEHGSAAMQFSVMERARATYPNWRQRGNLGLCSCPGKKVRLSGPVNGRATIERDLDLDFERVQNMGFTRVVCCLYDEELAFLGSPFGEYERAANAHGLDVVRVPMVEGGTPASFEEMDAVLVKVNETTSKGENVLVHCRGGVGRAAVVACCWMLDRRLLANAENAIAWARHFRSPKAIETQEQAQFCQFYSYRLQGVNQYLVEDHGAQVKQRRQLEIANREREALTRQERDRLQREFEEVQYELAKRDLEEYQQQQQQQQQQPLGGTR